MLGGKYEQVEHYFKWHWSWRRKTVLEERWHYRHWILGGTALAQGKIQEAHELMQESVNLYRQVGHQDELGWALACAGEYPHYPG